MTSGGNRKNGEKMDKRMTNKKIETLDKKISQLQARKTLEKNRLRQQKRKEDTRKKILIGTYYLNEAEEKGDMERLKKRMDGFLSRDNDRKLFGLKPLSKATAAQKPKSKKQ
jgi:hypothetical protein